MNQHPLKGQRGLRRIVKATGYSIDGLRMAWANESAFRQEVCLAVVMLPAAFWLGSGWVEQSLLVGTVLMVLIVELMNSAVEAAVDHTSMELHPLAQRAKDIGSAAVFLTLLWCGLTWAMALWSRFFNGTPAAA